MSTKPDSSQIKHETGTLKDIADASKPLADYTALRAYTGTATTVRITSTGIAGFFSRDSDVVTADNGGTVIVDGSGRRWKRVFDGAVNVRWFGAVGGGVTDDTVPVQAAADYAALIGSVLEVNKVFSVTTIAVSAGIGGIVCAKGGVIKGRGTASVAVIVLGTSINPVIGAKFDLRMDMSAGDLRAVQGENTSSCDFTGCHIYGFVNHSTLNHYAFWMSGACNGNTFARNHLELYPTPTQRGFGIAFYGTGGTALPWGGFFDGVISRAQYPAVGNTIVGNVINHGSYAISLQHAEYNAVSANYCNNQNHRSVFLGDAAWGNAITGNTFREYLSTAVLICYGSSNNAVVGNYCEKSLTVGGEAAINVTTGSRGNLIEANKIRSATNYGIYVATDSIDTTIIGNDIGEQYSTAIAIENDWIAVRPTNASFSRPNYEAPPAPYTAWSQLDMTGVSIKNNVIRAGYSGRNTTAIYIAQITSAGNTKTSNVELAGNSVISGDNLSYNLYLFQETADSLTDLRFYNNDFHEANLEVVANSSTLFSTWNDKISYFNGNKKLDKLIVVEEITFPNGNTTPNVATNTGVANNRMFVFSNSIPTSVTDFTGQFENQEIVVRLDTNTTIVYNSGLIRTKGSTNITGSANTLVAFKKIGAVWMEMWRNY